MTETPHIFFEKGKGWFFLDEASFFHGYWKTKQQAEKEFSDYCRIILGFI